MTYRNHHSRDEILIWDEQDISDETRPLLNHLSSSSQNYNTITRHPSRIEKNRPDHISWYDHFANSVLPHIMFPMCIVLLWSSMVLLLVWYNLISLDMIPANSNWLLCIHTAITMLLTFRMNSCSYSRYWEAEVLLSRLRSNARSLHILFRQYLSIQSSSSFENGVDISIDNLKMVAERLLLGFMVSAAFVLEGKNTQIDRVWESDPRLSPILTILSNDVNEIQVDQCQMDGKVPILLNQLPLLILDQLSAIASSQKQWERPIRVSVTGIIGSLSDTYSSMERIKTSPSPPAYTIHVNQTLFLYLVLLPFELLSGGFHGSSFILYMALVSFVLLGVEALARMLTHPFAIMNLHRRVHAFEKEQRFLQ